MFGMGFSEIVLIAIVAILFLGPDKLPDAMVQIAKFLNSIKKTVNEAKSTFEEEVRIKELKEEAMNYRRSLENAASDISGFKNSIPNPVHDLEEALGDLRGDGPGNRLYDDEEDEEDEEDGIQTSETPDSPSSHPVSSSPSPEKPGKEEDVSSDADKKQENGKEGDL
jgi:sec-independent protein translocase protein TatB